MPSGLPAPLLLSTVCATTPVPKVMRIVVPKNSPATDTKSLIEHVNKQPGTLNYSTVGLGSTQHLVAEHLRQRTGMKAQAISYRTTGEVVTSLLRGDAAYAVELYHLGCQYAQGAAFGEPMTADEAERLLGIAAEHSPISSARRVVMGALRT